MRTQQQDLPVWLYWEGEMPEWIACCERTIRAHARNLRVLGAAEFEALRGPDADIDISQLCIAHRSDFIRAFLLHWYGGLWIDSDCLVTKDLQRWIDCLTDYEFIGYKERQKHVANNFMVARPGSRIVREFYNRLCKILRSGQQLHWTTLGSSTLTSTISDLNLPWLQLGYELIQPICWSRPHEFFAIKSDAEHAALFNERSTCYMLSNNMVQNFSQSHCSNSLLDSGTFFRFVYELALRYPGPTRLFKTEMSIPWDLMPFCAQVIGQLEPLRVLDTNIGFGRFGFLVREICENRERTTHRENWRTWMEGVASSSTAVEEYHHHLYNWIHVGGREAFLPRLEEGWNLVILNSALDLGVTLKASEYVLLVGPIEAPWAASSYRTLIASRIARDNLEGAFLYSHCDPKFVRNMRLGYEHKE